MTGLDHGSPAEQSGFQIGDILIQVGEVELDQTHSYINALYQNKPGDALTIILVRDGNEKQVQVFPGESVR